MLTSWRLPLKSAKPIRFGPNTLTNPGQRLCAGCFVRITRERGRGQFPQACEPETLQERFSCRKAQTAVGTGEFLHKLEIPKFDDEPALVGIEKPVDFRLADWLLKGDAREHFEGRRCQFEDFRSRHSVRSHMRPTPCCGPL